MVSAVIRAPGGLKPALYSVGGGSLSTSLTFVEKLVVRSPTHCERTSHVAFFPWTFFLRGRTRRRRTLLHVFMSDVVSFIVASCDLVACGYSGDLDPLLHADANIELHGGRVLGRLPKVSGISSDHIVSPIVNSHG